MERNACPLFSRFANRPSAVKVRAHTVHPAVAPRAEAYFLRVPALPDRAVECACRNYPIFAGSTKSAERLTSV